MSLTWMNNGFICKDLYVPFVLEKDSDYIDDLKKKYKIVLQQAESAGADDESLKILKKILLRLTRWIRAMRFLAVQEQKFSFLDVEWEIHLMLMWQKTCCICR